MEKDGCDFYIPDKKGELIMLKKSILLSIIISVFILIIPVGAESQFTDVKDGYWAKGNIDFIANSGYMVGYGSRFGILDKITEGQFVAVLCRILGYKNQSPLTTEGPARELGLVQESESLNVTGNLKRSNMAKYSVRAFELINPNVSYPDYLKAYRGLVTDYDQLDSELQNLVLKCVEKGLIAGGPDGSFDPEGESTRAQAAAIIHRMLSQDERNKVMPVFAEPDLEFEAFMAKKELAGEFCSIREIYQVVDGRVIWDGTSGWGDYDQSLLPIYNNKDANRIAYNLLKELVKEAHKNNNYVRTRYQDSESITEAKGVYRHKVAVFEYYCTKFAGLKATEYKAFTTTLWLYPHTMKDYWPDYKGQKAPTVYEWEIGNLFDADDDITKDLVALKHKTEKYTLPLQNAFKSVYDDITGEAMYKHSIKEYDATRATWGTNKNYINLNLIVINGIEVQNRIGDCNINIGTSK